MFKKILILEYTWKYGYYFFKVKSGDNIKQNNNNNILKLIVLSFVLILGPSLLSSQNNPPPPLYLSPEGKLIYTPDENGNRIPDFSYCGYMASEQKIPDVPVRIIVPLKKGDATRRIQAAINYIASLPIDKNGFR